jgi:hypothetical protein
MGLSGQAAGPKGPRRLCAGPGIGPPGSPVTGVCPRRRRASPLLHSGALTVLALWREERHGPNVPVEGRTVPSAACPVVRPSKGEPLRVLRRAAEREAVEAMRLCLSAGVDGSNASLAALDRAVDEAIQRPATVRVRLTAGASPGRRTAGRPRRPARPGDGGDRRGRRDRALPAVEPGYGRGTRPQGPPESVGSYGPRDHGNPAPQAQPIRLSARPCGARAAAERGLPRGHRSVAGPTVCAPYPHPPRSRSVTMCPALTHHDTDDIDDSESRS